MGVFLTSCLIVSALGVLFVAYVFIYEGTREIVIHYYTASFVFTSISMIIFSLALELDTTSMQSKFTVAGVTIGLYILMVCSSVYIIKKKSKKTVEVKG